MLIINNLQFELNGEILFQPINLQLSAGDCLQLTGPNGVGKTTALKILAGTMKARRGRILWNNLPVSSLAPFAKYLGHDLALKPELSVIENLTYYAHLFHAKTTDIKQACDFFDLAKQKSSWIETLSSGQKHRCQLAKLLIGETSIWLLDEPFTALDQKHISQLVNLFQLFLTKGGIIIFTSHHLLTSPPFPIKNFLLSSYEK